MTGRTISFLAKHKVLVYLLFVLCTIVTLLLTLLPPGNFDGIKLFQYDKLGHFLMFFGWTLLFGFSWMIKSEKKVRLWLVFLIGAMFGIGIEITQGLLPYERSPNTYDALADIAGSFSAVVVLAFLQNKYREFLKSS